MYIRRQRVLNIKRLTLNYRNKKKINRTGRTNEMKKRKNRRVNRK